MQILGNFTCQCGRKHIVVLNREDVMFLSSIGAIKLKQPFQDVKDMEMKEFQKEAGSLGKRIRYDYIQIAKDFGEAYKNNPRISPHTFWNNRFHKYPTGGAYFKFRDAIKEVSPELENKFFRRLSRNPIKDETTVLQN